MRQRFETRAMHERIAKDIRRATWKHHSAEEKIRVVLEGQRGAYSIVELCGWERTAESLYHS
jgi:transposase